jgi:hypothetical protein
MRETLYRIKNQDLECTAGQMGRSILGIGAMESKMALELYIHLVINSHGKEYGIVDYL